MGNEDRSITALYLSTHPFEFTIKSPEQSMMHPLVRDLYKRVLLVGRDYPAGLDYVKVTWKKAFRNSENCPSCYLGNDPLQSKACQQELTKAVARGRFMVREMEGVIQLKKYRAMKKRYGQPADDPAIQQAMQRLEGQEGAAGEHR
jgi:hypothetical protein